MAEVTTRVCDLCPGETKSRPQAEERLPFAVRSKSYVLDVCDEHKREVEGAFETLTKVAASSKAPAAKGGNGGKDQAGVGADGLTSEERRACSAWAKEQGHKVGPRLAAKVVEEWRSAGAPQAAAA